MKVYELMTQEVQTVHSQTLVCEAARIMEESRIGFLPVMAGPHVIGVLTDRDIALRVVGHGLSSVRTKVVSVMTPEPVFLYDDQDLGEAVELMCSKSIGRLLVQNRRGMFVGLLSFADIATLADPDSSEAVAEALGETYWQSHMFASVHPRKLTEQHTECLN